MDTVDLIKTVRAALAALRPPEPTEPLTFGEYITFAEQVQAADRALIAGAPAWLTELAERLEAATAAEPDRIAKLEKRVAWLEKATNHTWKCR